MWLAVQFICNAQRTQTEKAKVPVQPFMLNDYSVTEPTEFEFCYVQNGVKYIYGFSATQSEIITEYLRYTPNGREATIFNRENGSFLFPQNSERRHKEMIAKAVAKNQLFFSVSCAMNSDRAKTHLVRLWRTIYSGYVHNTAYIATICRLVF